MLALLIKALLIQAFSIPSGSMMHTLEIKDRVLVNKLIYDVRGIHRGEIVVFNGIDDWAPRGSRSPSPRAPRHRACTGSARSSASRPTTRTTSSGSSACPATG